MKRKTFFTTLILFLLFFNAAILLITATMLRDNLAVQKERGLAEHYVIVSSLTKDMQALEGRGADISASLDGLMGSYAYFSQGSRMRLALYRGGEQVFTNMEGGQGAAPDMSGVLLENRRLWLEGEPLPAVSIAGRLPEPYGDYLLTYRYDISESLEQWRQTKNRLYLFGGVFSVLLALSLLLLLGRVFRPLGQISEASQSIAAGDYRSRLPVEGGDELADLSRSFNHMVDEIESQMAALHAASEQKQRFADNLAHELRTPLTAIYGYAEYIQRAVISEEDKLSATDYIMSQCRRMQSMTGQLLNMAVLRRSEAANESVPVCELFSAAAATIHPKAEEKAVKISYHNGLDCLNGNHDLLQSLLVNLLDNAVKACARGGQVCVRAYGEDGGAVISVADNGKGISAENLAHLTEAFYRADKARSREDGGAGLGLSICEQIAEAHNGRMQFFSEVGKGTTVKITFLQLDNKSVIT